MKLAVEFPSVAYREGSDGVLRLARAIEDIGYDELDMFDHVVMGFPREGRPPGIYPANMPILEAFMTLAYVAAFDPDLPLERARTIPAAWYRDAGLYEAERRDVFGRSWLAAGRVVGETMSGPRERRLVDEFLSRVSDKN